MKCSCAEFERLEGASVPAYISAFLEQVDSANVAENKRYRCRVCGSVWEKRAPEVESAAQRPSLVRVGQPMAG